jgi:hypothetical protein
MTPPEKENGGPDIGTAVLFSSNRWSAQQVHFTTHNNQLTIENVGSLNLSAVS